MKTRRHRPEKAASSESFEELVGHSFAKPELATWALTHRSLSYETAPEVLADPASDNEQLEFVGDAVLGLVVAEALFRQFPASREGELTRLRASLVSRRHLAGVAARIDLGSRLRLGKGEEASGGRGKPALLANALEAVIAALYLDGGLPAARRFVEDRIVRPALPELKLALENNGTFSGAIGDHKSALQEFLQANGSGAPRYVLRGESGPDHQRVFRVAVELADSSGGNASIAESEGHTKKEAQQKAARLALQRLSTAGTSISRPGGEAA